MDLSQYRNIDGTYTSPKNGKIYRSEKALRAHIFHVRTEKSNDFYELNKKNNNCDYCGKLLGCGNKIRHEKSCYLNPINLRECLVCGAPIKDYSRSKGTCSHSCSNVHFRDLRNKPEKFKRYATICWSKHKKECIICGENKIVAVHHYNENHDDDRVENLVPLCPTHHQYIHSRFKSEIVEIVDKYVAEFKNKQSVA